MSIIGRVYRVQSVRHYRNVQDFITRIYLGSDILTCLGICFFFTDNVLVVCLSLLCFKARTSGKATKHQDWYSWHLHLLLFCLVSMFLYRRRLGVWEKCYIIFYFFLLKSNANKSPATANKNSNPGVTIRYPPIF